MSLLLTLLTFVLVVISLLMVLLILMQRAKDGGVGAALGGGIAEATLGGEAGNVLSKATTYGAVLFFVIAFGLYLGRIHQDRTAKAEPAPAMPSLAPANSTLPDSLTLPPAEGPGAAPVEGSTLSPGPGDATVAPTIPPVAEPAPAGTPASATP